MGVCNVRGTQVAHGVAYACEQSESRLRKHRYDTIVEGVGIDRLTANFWWVCGGRVRPARGGGVVCCRVLPRAPPPRHRHRCHGVTPRHVVTRAP